MSAKNRAKTAQRVLSDRQKAFDQLPSDKKNGRKRPGSMSGRK